MDQRSSRSRIDRSKETVRQNCLQDLPRKKRQSVHAIMPQTSGSTSYGLIASTDDEDPEFMKELEEYQERQEEKWYKDNISLFVNNWEVFKHQLQNHFFPSIVLSVDINSLAETDDHQQKTSDNLKSQIATNEVFKQDSNRDLVRTIDSLPKYSGGIEAESWLNSIISTFSKLQLRSDEKLDYIPITLQENALFWYQEVEDDI
ncbi:unnamed protein product, partial [Didymodactylos carnosus]